METDWKTITAIVGAVTGSASLCWNVIIKLQESGRLKVCVEVTSIHQVGENGKVSKIDSHLNIKVTNVGKNPVTLTNVRLFSGHQTFSIRRKLGLSEKENGVFSWIERDGLRPCRWTV